MLFDGKFRRRKAVRTEIFTDPRGSNLQRDEVAACLPIVLDMERVVAV